MLPRRRSQKEHHPAIPYGQLHAFIQTMRVSPADRLTRQGLEFLVLTVVRSGEVRLMDWGEVGLESAAWTVPAAP